MFWYETTMLMIDATLKDYTLKGRYRLVMQLLLYLKHKWFVFVIF